MSSDPSQRSPLSSWPRPLAFVFSGGGAYGATQVGMIRALTQAGINPDLVVGTSVGALNGALYADNPILAAERLTEIWQSLERVGVFGGRTRPGRAWSAIRNGFKRETGLVSPAALRSLIDQHLPVERIEDLRIPTAVVVTDALVGQAKLLTQGNVGPALQASAAIPGVFPPVKIDGCFYVDGGVTANVPIRQAIGFGARSIVVLDANPASMPGTLPNTAMSSVVHASMIMLRNQRADATDDLVGRHPILHLPQVTPTTQSSFDFKNSEALIEAGFTGTTEFIRQLPDLADSKRSANGLPDALNTPTRQAPDPSDDVPAEPQPDSTVTL